MTGVPKAEDKRRTRGKSRDGEREPQNQRRELVSRLFTEHNNALVSFLTARLHCEQEARDVAQEAYVRMLQLDQSSVSFHKAYLFRIAENLATDRVRQCVVRERVTKDDLFQILQEPVEPERRVLAQSELADVQRRLQELPPKCRYAFVQHVLLEKPVKEIAAKMELSERMIRHYVVRGLAYCRSLLDKDEEREA